MNPENLDFEEQNRIAEEDRGQQKKELFEAKSMDDFKIELEQLINQHSIENYCDMPDFILAEMLCNLIQTIGESSKKNLDWHGCDSICHPRNNSKNV